MAATTTTSHLSMSGRVGRALATSALFPCAGVVGDLLTFSFVPADAFILTFGLIALVVGVILVRKDPFGRQMGWRLWIQRNPFGNVVVMVGHSCILAGSIILSLALIVQPRSAYYSFENSLPMLVIGAGIYLVGWLLLLFGDRLKTTL